MDKRIEDSYRLIQDVLLTYTHIPYAYGDIHCKPIFDQEHDSYALMTLGLQGVKRILVASYMSKY